jgi:hypothetical protein
LRDGRRFESFHPDSKEARSKGGLLFFTALCSVSRKDCGMVEGSNPFANAFIQTVKKARSKGGLLFFMASGNHSKSQIN